MKIFNIVPECHVDTRLTELLARIILAGHQHGKGNVSNKLEIELRNTVALGIVDEDMNKGNEPKYFTDNFTEITKQNNLILKTHKILKQYLIVICPEIEKWLNDNAEAAGILPEDYSLPKNFKKFTKICKSKDIRRNLHFDAFIKQLIKAQTPGIITFKIWLEKFIAGEELL